MMGKVLDAGSLNIDYVCRAPGLADAGETVKGKAGDKALGLAAWAAAVSVTRPGAADSIPVHAELKNP